MTKLIATLAAAGLALAATTAHAQTLQLTYPTDASMSCDQISAEMVRMDQVMGVSNGAIASAEGAARGAETAASLGINAALYSGALGRVPGLGMFANAAASQAKAAAAAKAQRETQNIQVAQQRRAIMAGLHQGKCGAAAAVIPATLTTTTPAPAALPTLATTQDVILRGSAAPNGASVGTVKAGGAVYPTGQRNGVWIEVDDENGARGWMSSAFAKAK
ncbi:SH3 domain-containing protein [Caulobacter segnis]